MANQSYYRGEMTLMDDHGSETVFRSYHVKEATLGSDYYIMNFI